MAASRKHGSERDENFAPFDEADAVPNYYDEENPPPRPDRKSSDFAGSKLPWLVHDFGHATASVYEAVMIAAHRARQVGRIQKREIDAYNSSQVLTPESIEEEEASEKGIDHFNHIKPTIKSLGELMDNKLEYYYPDDERNK